MTPAKPIRHVMRVFHRNPCLALLLMLAAPARADVVDLINEVRARGCAGLPGVESPLRVSAELNRAARALASGGRLRDAVADAGYRAARSASLEVSGDDTAVAAAIAREGCSNIADAAFTELGVERRNGSAWIIVAAPLVPPAATDAQAVGARVLALVNDARAEPRRCGWKRFDAASPLARSTTLDRAALAHARDMATHSNPGHTGSDGSTADVRATRAGYRWRRVAENVASGQQTPEEVVADWVTSARHCANLMDPDFTEMGVGFAADPKSAAGIYWSQLLGSPGP